MTPRSNDTAKLEKGPEVSSDDDSSIVVFTPGSGMAEHQRNVENVIDRHIGRIATIDPTEVIDHGHRTTLHLKEN